MPEPMMLGLDGVEPTQERSCDIHEISPWKVALGVALAMVGLLSCLFSLVFMFESIAQVFESNTAVDAIQNISRNLAFAGICYLPARMILSLRYLGCKCLNPTTAAEKAADVKAYCDCG